MDKGQMMSRVTVLAMIIAAFSSMGIAAADSSPVSLDVAVEKGLVEVQVKGRGACAGDAIQVDVRRKVDREVRVVIQPGMVMKNASGKVQSMVCHGVKYRKDGSRYRRVDEMTLNNNTRQTYLVEAFCRDFSKPTPGAGNSFQADEEDVPSTSVIVKGKTAGASLKTIQIAVWIQRGVSREEIRRRFRATEAEFKAAGALVEAASASSQGDSAAEAAADESVRVHVKNALDEYLQRLQDRPFHRGDKVEVTADSTPIRGIRRTLGTARKGETFEVLRVGPRNVVVEYAEGDGEPTRRGTIDADDIRLVDNAPRGEGRPLLRQLGELVSESELEVITLSQRGL